LLTLNSIGLGGGSIVRKSNGTTTVGPDSVGYQIQTEALVFGGKIATATDFTVAGENNIEIGNPALVKGVLDIFDIHAYREAVKTMLEKIIDTMKTSPDDLAVLLVGGGAVIAPDTLKGASRVLKPNWSGVANAIGAAIAQVSAVIDTVESTESKTTKQHLEEISVRVIDKAVDGGAVRNSVKVVEIETLPLQVN
jgi:N-methylhydantoinase A/oxoprolinase/acetone carboxylase beta subunit